MVSSVLLQGGEGRALRAAVLVHRWLQFSLSCRYVAPEYAKTGMLNERSDVYSFGVLVMEVITGRTPVDYTRPADEVSYLPAAVLSFVHRLTSHWIAAV